MVTGEAPFRGDSVYATMTKRLKTDPDAPSKVRPECPPALDKVIFKAMQREPQNRYQAAVEMFMDLQKIAVEQGFRTAITGGVFMPSATAAASYVGPSLSSGHAGADSDVVEPRSSSKESTGSLAEAWGGRGDGAMVSAPTESLPRTNKGLGGLFETESPGPATVRISLDEIDLEGVEDEPNRPAHAGQLGSASSSHSDPFSDSWSEPRGAGNISSRVRDISHRYHEQQARKSYFVDAMLLFAAMLFGIGVGFLALKMIYPSVLDSIPFVGR
jgi:serine/threonine protein kinase